MWCLIACNELAHGPNWRGTSVWSISSIPFKPNQLLLYGTWTLRNKLQWNLNKNISVSKMVAWIYPILNMLKYAFILFVRWSMGKRSGRSHVPRQTSSNGTRSSRNENASDKDINKGAYLLFFLTPLVIFSAIGYYRLQDHWRELVRSPLDAPKMVPEGSTSAMGDPDKFWGTYRPGVYFGLKTRSPQSPVVGLMWMTEFTGEMPPPIRHWCEQSDQLPMYTWFIHDGVNFGHQELVDRYFTVATDFAKRPGGQHGGDWTARIGLTARVSVPA